MVCVYIVVIRTRVCIFYRPGARAEDATLYYRTVVFFENTYSAHRCSYRNLWVLDSIPFLGAWCLAFVVPVDFEPREELAVLLISAH